MSLKVLKGREVLGIMVDETVRQTRASAKSPSRAYFIATHEGKGFTVNQKFMDAFTKGEIAEVQLTEGEYSVDDPMNPGQQISRKSWTLASFANKTQVKSMTEFDREISEIENPELAKVTLNDDLLAQLQAALAPKQIAG
jgi:hypothetical protein